MIELSNAKVSEINPNPIVIYDAMAIVRSVSSEKTWEPLFQTLVKALRLQEAEETILVFDNYSDNQEFFLRQQERMNRLTNGTVRVYIGESTQEMPEVTPINNALKTQKTRLNSLTDLHNAYIKTTYAQN